MISLETLRAGEMAAPELLPELVAHFTADRECLERLWSVPYSPGRRERLRAFLSDWRRRVAEIPFDDLSASDRAVTTKSNIRGPSHVGSDGFPLVALKRPSAVAKAREIGKARSRRTC